MPTITKISPQKNQRRANIYFDGKFTLGLSLNTLAKIGLKVGDHLTEKQVQDITAKAYIDKLENKALCLLSFRPRSTREVKDKLAVYFRSCISPHTPIPPNLITAVIDKLTTLKLLDDRQFALWWIKERQTVKPAGKRLLAMELHAKGIDRDMIDEIFNRHWQPENEEAHIKKLLAKKIPVTAGLPLLKRKKKCLDLLIRRGFDYQKSRILVDQMLAMK